jgi:predicted nuclease of predicted toxin-antitoxin system
MKLLLDANISLRLANRLKAYLDDCFHVDYIGLEIPATDTAIWNFALAENLIIITNDEDFLNFSNIKSFPPKIVLLRTGNQSNSYVEELLIKHKKDIEQLYYSDDYGVLELF